MSCRPGSAASVPSTLPQSHPPSGHGHPRVAPSPAPSPTGSQRHSEGVRSMEILAVRPVGSDDVLKLLISNSTQYSTFQHLLS